MNPRLMAFATRTVPRYTSYPTVPHFSEAVGPDAGVDRLAGLDPAEPVSLYLHVPFCRQLCRYCGCNMKLARRDAPIRDYVETLEREIRLIAGFLPGRMKVGHLHWGGGTPTAMAPDALDGAMRTIRSLFEIEAGAEIAIECDPRTLDGAMARRIGELGFTRASFGVQEFDPEVQAAIGRLQPPDMVRRAVDALRGAGVGGINFDLIYGLPHQNVEKLVKTVGLCVDMAPERLALFGYAHVPWMAKRQRLIDEAALPGIAERLAQARAAETALVAAGYRAIGLDHFALPGDDLAKAAEAGTLRRNFQGYTTDRARTLLGFGVTAIGRTPRGFVQNFADVRAWERAIAGGVPPVARGHDLEPDDAVRAAAIEALMCHARVDLAAVTEGFAVSPDWYRDCEPDLAELARAGVIVRDGTTVAVTGEARPLVRVVASVFDAFLPRNRARHSLAV